MRNKSSIFTVGLTVVAAVSGCGSPSSAPATPSTQTGAADQLSVDRVFASVSELGAALHEMGFGCDAVKADSQNKGTCQTNDFGLTDLYTFASISERDTTTHTIGVGFGSLCWQSAMRDVASMTYVQGNTWIVGPGQEEATNRFAAKVGRETATWCLPELR